MQQTPVSVVRHKTSHDEAHVRDERRSSDAIEKHMSHLVLSFAVMSRPSNT